MPGSVPSRGKRHLDLVGTRRGVMPAPIRRCPTCGISYAGEERFCPADGTPLESHGSGDASLRGRTIAGRYLIRRPIGRGGMGVVYLANHIGLKKPVAIKFLLERHTEDRDVVERFRREAQTTSHIGHDNIVAVTDIGEEDRRWYIVMEHLSGRDLAAVLRDEGTLGFDRAVWIVSQALRGLGAAHAQGVLHRDMKPENVFIAHRQNGDEIVKIMDFGISKIIDAHDSKVRLTSTGAIIGTPIYMAPEQAHASPNLDHRVDIYAVGVMLYQMLAGRPPFIGDNSLMLLTQHVTDPPPPIASFRPDCPRALAACIHRALAKNPADRYASTDEFRADLERAVPGSLRAGARVRRKLPWRVPVAVMALVAAAVAVLWVMPSDAGEDHPQSRAVVEPISPDARAQPAAVVAAPEPRGILDVDSSPPGAQVIVNGVARGATPLVLEDIPAGAYEIELRLPDFREAIVSRRVTANGRTVVYAVLAKARPPRRRRSRISRSRSSQKSSPTKAAIADAGPVALPSQGQKSGLSRLRPIDAMVAPPEPAETPRSEPVGTLPEPHPTGDGRDHKTNPYLPP